MRRFRFLLARLVLAVLAAAASARPVEIRLVHTTDLHGRILPTRDYEGREDVGGLLRGATVIRRLRAERPNTLLLDGGDLYQGSLEGLLSGGRIMTRALEALQYDAWVLGNHEFDWGLPKLRRVHDAAATPMLAANITGLGGEKIPLGRLQPFLLREFDGVRVAVVGLTTPGIPTWSLPDQLGNMVFARSVDALRRVMPAVRAAAPDVIVLAAHQGYREWGDDHANEIKAIAANFPEIAVILGAHTHKAVPDVRLGDTLYTQAGYYGLWIGCVDLTYDTVERRIVRRASALVPVDEKVPFDAGFEKLFAQELQQARDLAAERVGELTDDLGGAADAQGRTPVQQLICRAIAAASGADAVLHNPLSPDGLRRGPLTVADVWRVVPFENRVGVLHLTTAELSEILAENAARKNTSHYLGGYGLAWKEETDAGGQVRIADIRGADGRPFHPRRRIKVAFNSYVLASGGLRYPRLRDIARRPEVRMEILAVDTREAVLSFLRRHRSLGLADVAPAP